MCEKTDKKENQTSETDNWLLLCSSISEVEAILIRDSLGNSGIKTHILNKQDSMYPMLGQVELYVRANDFDTAREILNSSNTTCDA